MSEFRRRLMMYQALKNKNTISYPGLVAAWSAKGKTNEDEDRAILKDLTGNGHDINLFNFAFNTRGSGYGGYPTVLNKWKIGSGGSSVFLNEHTLKITNIRTQNQAVIYSQDGTNYVGSFKISNLKEGQSVGFGSDIGGITILKVDTDGIYDVDWSKNANRSPCIMCDFIGECDITVELLPSYPDALVFDGVDDYGKTNTLLSLQDYTIILKRKLISSDKKPRWTVSHGKTNTKCLFFFENTATNSCYNFGRQTNVKLQSSLISWQNKYYFNNSKISYSNITPDVDNFYLGCLSFGGPREFMRFAFYSAYLFDRSLPPEEIKDFINKYIDKDYELPT